MKKITLHIDTSVSQEARIEVSMDGHVFSKKAPDDGSRSQALLRLIESLLTQHNVPLSAITEITVVTGPGSFTGIRVGLAVANTLATLLGIPVNGLPAGKAGKKVLATPTYS